MRIAKQKYLEAEKFTDPSSIQSRKKAKDIKNHMAELDESINQAMKNKSGASHAVELNDLREIPKICVVKKQSLEQQLYHEKSQK